MKNRKNSWNLEVRSVGRFEKVVGCSVFYKAI